MTAPTFYTGDVWRLLIVHSTALTYPHTVHTSYNEVRMQPLDEPGQAVLSSRLEIDPFEGVTGYGDYFGTRVAAFDVHRPHRHLTVTATSTVETYAVARSEEAWTWDRLAESDVHDRMEEFLTPTPLTELDDELHGLADQIRDAADSPGTAGREVAALIRRSMKYETGATGVHTSAVEAWQEKRGVCQDFSHVACALLRSIGVPARYVSRISAPGRRGRDRPDCGGPVARLGGNGSTAPGPLSTRPTGRPPGHAHVITGRGPRLLATSPRCAASMPGLTRRGTTSPSGSPDCAETRPFRPVG